MSTAQVNTEVATALATYDPPTNAELISEINTVQVDIAAVQTDTNDLQARLPAALTAGGNIKADLLALNGNTTSPIVLDRSARR